MTDWLNINKDWVFSGVGIFIVASSAALLSSIVTWLLQRRAEGKKQMRVAVDSRLKKYSVENRIKNEQLLVSYGGTTYENLCEYHIQVRNIGKVAICSQSFLIRLPKQTKLIENEITASSITIECNSEQLSSGEEAELVHGIGRLEPGDHVNILCILDTPNSDRISYQPRGADGVVYQQSGGEPMPEITQAIHLTAMILLIGTVPLIGTYFQVFALVLLSSKITGIIESFRKSPTQDKAIYIQNSKFGEGAQVNVVQES